MNHQEFYYTLTKTEVPLHTLFSENLFSDYNALKEFLDKEITSEYCFSPEEQAEDKKGRPIVPSKAQLRFGASYMMLSIYGKYNREGLDKCIRHVKDVEWDQLEFIKSQLKV